MCEFEAKNCKQASVQSSKQKQARIFSNFACSQINFSRKVLPRDLAVEMDCEDMIITEEPNLTERKEGGKRGRKPGRKATSEKIDMKAKLERSRQSARECRARKKLRYQYLEELVADREKAVFALRNELERYKQWNAELDAGRLPEGFQQLLEELGVLKQE